MWVANVCDFHFVRQEGVVFKIVSMFISNKKDRHQSWVGVDYFRHEKAYVLTFYSAWNQMQRYRYLDLLYRCSVCIPVFPSFRKKKWKNLDLLPGCRICVSVLPPIRKKNQGNLLSSAGFLEESIGILMHFSAWKKRLQNLARESHCAKVLML